MTQRLFCWIWKCFYALDDLFLCYHKRSRSIQNLFQSLVFSTLMWHKTSSVIPAFNVLILLLFFQIIKVRQCCGFTFTNFLLFLTVTNVLVTSWVNFSTRMNVCFSYFLIWFSHGSLMETNSTHVYFRSWMSCFDDEKQKVKNTFKDNSQSEYFIY